MTDIKEALEDIFKAIHINTLLVWTATVMATIAAINTLINTQIYRWLVFLAVGLISLLIYNKKYKK